jgi:hypothetical protein
MKTTRVMSWDEIDKDWNGLQKRHRSEIAQRVARYCVGHSVTEVAARLKHDRRWVQRQIDRAGIETALCKGVIEDQLNALSSAHPLKSGSQSGSYGQNDVYKDIQRIIKDYGPTEDDEEDFEPYVQHYEQDYGVGSPVAERIARAQFATEKAIEEGVIQESTNKRNQKVNQILFPSDDGDTYELRLQHHMAHVKAAARFLDEAKMPLLRRKSTREKVASANAMWLEQVERIRNLHPTFDGVS